MRRELINDDDDAISSDSDSHHEQQPQSQQESLTANHTPDNSSSQDARIGTDSTSNNTNTNDTTKREGTPLLATKQSTTSSSSSSSTGLNVESFIDNDVQEDDNGNQDDDNPNPTRRKSIRFTPGLVRVSSSTGLNVLPHKESFIDNNGQEDDNAYNGRRIKDRSDDTKDTKDPDKDKPAKVNRILRFNEYTHKLYTMLLHWMIRTMFVNLFLFFLCIYYSIILLLTMVIMLVSWWEPECYTLIGNDEGEGVQVHHFLSSFALSWTTFTTVGYGHIYPSLSEESDTFCIATQLTMITIIFIGILYVGVCGAIFFGKVRKIVSVAPIKFSDIVVVRYGTGLKEGSRIQRSLSRRGVVVRKKNGDEYTVFGGDSTTACPILEFRLMNLHNSTPGNELFNGKLSCIATYKPDNQDIGASYHKNNNKSTTTGKKRHMEKIELTNGERPFFNTSWNAVHVLNEHSPLLTCQMRNRLKQLGKGGGGSNVWPAEMNSVQGINSCLSFNEIAVTYSGMGSGKGSPFYAHNVFARGDIIIGYQFVPILKRNKKKKMIVHEELFNDVYPQNGSDPGQVLIKKEQQRRESMGSDSDTSVSSGVHRCGIAVKF